MPIEITDKEIEFYAPFENGREPLPPHTFTVIVGYVCPECGRILTAYWKAETLIDVFGYEVSRGDEQKSAFRHFHVDGGQGIELREHDYSDVRYSNNGKLCKLYAFRSMSFLENVNGLLEMYNLQSLDEVTPEQKERLSKMDEITLIPDVCGRGEPMILLNPSGIILRWDCNRYSSYDTYEEAEKRCKKEFGEKLLSIIS